ncbi:hypothetical protein [Novosphingobium sp. 1529]
MARDGDAFAARMAAWPKDVREHALLLVSGQAPGGSIVDGEACCG